MYGESKVRISEIRKLSSMVKITGLSGQKNVQMARYVNFYIIFQKALDKAKWQDYNIKMLDNGFVCPADGR